jgi:hypothetical protein
MKKIVLVLPFLFLTSCVERVTESYVCESIEKDSLVTTEVNVEINVVDGYVTYFNYYEMSNYTIEEYSDFIENSDHIYSLESEFTDSIEFESMLSKSSIIGSMKVVTNPTTHMIFTSKNILLFPSSESFNNDFWLYVDEEVNVERKTMQKIVKDFGLTCNIKNNQ